MRINGVGWSAVGGAEAGADENNGCMDGSRLHLGLMLRQCDLHIVNFETCYNNNVFLFDTINLILKFKLHQLHKFNSNTCF